MRAVSKPSLLWSIVLVMAALMLQGCQTSGPALPERGGWHPAANVRSYTPRYEVDRELAEAASSPDTLVGTDVFGIEGLSLTPMDEDDDLELSGELPKDMRDYEPKPMPRVRARTRHAAPQTPMSYTVGRELMCTGSETLCVTSPYGVYRGTHVHKGVDLRAPFGSPIKAFRGGKVVSAQYSGAYGYMVEIEQHDGLVARYAHMSQILTHAGAKVGPGQVIGRVGSTGRSTGPHLHFELIRNNGQLNPLTMLSRPGEVLTPPSSHDAEAARAALSANTRAREAQAAASRREPAVQDKRKGVHGRADRREEARDSRGRHSEQASSKKDGRRESASSDDRRKGGRDSASARKGDSGKSDRRAEAGSRKSGKAEARDASAGKSAQAAQKKGSDARKSAESAKKDQKKQAAEKPSRRDDRRDAAAKPARGKDASSAEAQKKQRSGKESAKKESSGKDGAKSAAQKKRDDRPARKSEKKS